MYPSSSIKTPESWSMFVTSLCDLDMLLGGGTQDPAEGKSGRASDVRKVRENGLAKLYSICQDWQMLVCSFIMVDYAESSIIGENFCGIPSTSVKFKELLRFPCACGEHHQRERNKSPGLDFFGFTGQTRQTHGFF
jgi:hypothetical protein